MRKSLTIIEYKLRVEENPRKNQLLRDRYYYYKRLERVVDQSLTDVQAKLRQKQ